MASVWVVLMERLRRASRQEEIDLWRLYHMVHYFELCEGKNVKVPKPPKASLRQQRKRVEACITAQVDTPSYDALASLCLCAVYARVVHALVCHFASRSP